MITVKKNNLFLDNKTPLLNGDVMSFSYTLKSEDIRSLDKSSMTPYNSHKKYFEELNDVSLETSNVDDGVRIEVTLQSDRYSEWGVNLPFNFMGKINGGDYQNQYLISSPYKDSENKNKYIYLSSPNKNNILILFESDASGWKIDYSPFVGGHFFSNLKILAQFDKEYEHDSGRKMLSFFVLQVKDFNDALDKVAKYSKKPVLSYDFSGGKIGQKITISIHGNCDFITDGEAEYRVKNQEFTYEIKRHQKTILTPYFKGQKGFECTVYGYENIQDLWLKSLKSISFDDINETDRNLCEHQCYISASLRYLLRYGKDEEVEKIVKAGLHPIMETDITKAVPRLTILNVPQKDLNYPAFHLYKSNRIQEQFFGVTIFLDAYKYFQEKIYLKYATKMMNVLIDYYQKDDGGFYAQMPWNSTPDDYSTVTCLIIPIIDLALYMKNRDDALYQKYLQSAQKLAQHVYQRGLDFPTETLTEGEHEQEMEDGSISCSALTLLYYSTHIKENKDYVIKAKEILELHETWMVNSPLCNAYRSSLRWWETNWEGDRDGPALCLGHAWTIWRAEADYWMYVATNDSSHLQKSINSFNSNFAKIHADGSSYSAFCIDYITGGGFNDKSSVRYQIASEFSKQKDSGLSRYLWIRLADSLINDLK